MEFNVNNAIQTILDGKTDKEEWRRFQEEQRAKFTPLDPIGQKVQYGARAIALSEEALQHDLTEGQRAFEIKRMAEGLAHQGFLEEAIKLDPHPEYIAKLEAVTIQGWCGCKESRFLKEVFLYRGQRYELYACPVCGFLNAE